MQGTTILSFFKRCWSNGPLALADETATLPLNVGQSPANDGVQYSRRTEFSNSPLRRPENKHTWI